MPNGPSLPFQLTHLPPDRFQVLGQVGVGGMARVLLARDRHLNRRVALKIPLEAARVARLVTEAQHQAALDHPHVLPVLEIGLWLDNPCMVLPYIEGPTLEEATRERDWRVAADLVRQAALGVHAAHRLGLLHLDLKPQNILLEQTPEGLRALVSDFGLARDATGESLTRSGPLAGSPPFMSPEQLLGDRAPDVRSDVYSLGATLYTLVTGAPPFHHQAPDRPGPVPPRPLDLFRQVACEPPLAPTRLLANLPRDLETLLMTCLEKKPEDRYPTASALAEDLDRLLSGMPIAARRPPPLRRLQGWARRHETLSTALGVAMALALVGGTLSLSVGRHARREAEVAARFEQSALELESACRMGRLSPDASLGLGWSDLEHQAERLKVEAGRLGSVADAPLAHALGHIRLLQDRNREALASLCAAWDGGLRSATLSRAIAEAALSICEEQADYGALPAHEGTSPEERLALQHLSLARAHLQRARNLGHRDPFLLARVARVMGQEREALERAEQTIRETPWRYEAHLLRFQVRAARTWEAPDLATYQARSGEALACLDAALQTGRSDPLLWMVRAEWMEQMAQTLAERFGRPDPGAQTQALEACERALAMAPGLERAHRVKVRLLFGRTAQALDGANPSGEAAAPFQRALAELERLGPDREGEPWNLLLRAWGHVLAHRLTPGAGGLPHFEMAQRLSRTVLEKHPHQPEAFQLQAFLLLLQVDQDRSRGQDPRGDLNRAIGIYERMRTLWPRRPEFHTMAMGATTTLMYECQAAGDEAGFEAAFQRVRAQADTARQAGIQPAFTCTPLAQATRLRAMLRALRGIRPEPDLETARGILDQLPVERSQGVSLLDERFTLAYEQALCALETGEDPRPRIRSLRDLLEQARRNGLQGDWLPVNEAALARLEALLDRNQGRDPGPAIRRGLANLQKARTRDQEVPLQGLMGALMVLQSPTGAAAARGRSLMAAAIRSEPTLAWTLRFEWRP